MLSDELISLRALEPEDLDFVYEFENETSMWSVGGQTAPYSHFAVKQYLSNCQNDLFLDRELRLVIVNRESGEVLGLVDFYNFEPRHNRAELGIGIVKQHRHKGIGRRTLELITHYAVYLHLHQLYVHVACSNVQSVHLFTQAGFVVTGRLTDWIIGEDGFEDVLVLQKKIVDQPSR